MRSESTSLSGTSPAGPQAAPGRRIAWLGSARTWIGIHGAGLRLGALFWIAYVFADPATSLFAHPRFGVQPWSPHPALAVALVAHGGSAYAPVVLAAVLGVWLLTPGASLDPVPLLAAFTLAATYWAAGLALRRWSRWGGPEIGPRDVNVLLLVGLAASICGAAVEALAQVASTALDWSALPLLGFRLFIAGLLGLVILVPVLMLAASGAWRGYRARMPGAAAARDVLLFVLALGALLILVFGMRPLDEFRMSYLLFLPMIVVAMRHGLVGVATANPLVQLGLLGALTLIGTRPGIAFEFQLLVLTLAIAALYLGALSDERQRSAARIAGHERALREHGRALADAQRVAATAELAAALAHDLSQPLSAIGTYARASRVLAEKGASEHARLGETLEQISQESARAGQYLRRMREFFRTGAMQEERVEVGALFDRTHAQLRERLVLAQIEWRVTIEPGLPAVCADAVQAGAVLGNLVGNACDALDAVSGWRQIHLRAYRAPIDPGAERAKVRITVQDTGPGVPAELRPRLFKPLATSKANGMGLGLALSRSIAERMNGALWFDAQTERTTFCLDLPVHG